jgi:tricarballylate dehydrogenase
LPFSPGFSTPIGGGIVTRLDSVPFGIVVNRDGQRFYDEGENFWPKRYAIWGGLIAAQPGQVAYSIIDRKVLTAFMPSVYPPLSARSLGELAAQLELDPLVVEETVRRFNAAVRPGSFDPAALDDCRTEDITPPKTHWAQPIDTPPFYGIAVRPGITFTYLGVKVDARGRVMLGDGMAMSNVFAAGEIMSGNVLSSGYLAGFGMTIGTVWGRIAGREAARHALG